MENRTNIARGGGESRIEGINALRAFGCSAIVAWHILANGGFQFDGYFAEEMIPSWNHLVYLFMIISGFGMCNGYYERIKNQDISVETFYSRRYRKILPFFALLIMADVLIEHSLESLAEGFIELTLVFGFLPNNELNVIGVAWTLGVIFVFYIVFPFIVFLVSNKRRAWLTFIISIVTQILCAAYFMTGEFVQVNYSPKHSFLFCVPYFGSGCLVYLYKESIIKKVRSYPYLSLAICFLATVLYYVIPHNVGTFSTNELIVLGLYTVWLMYAIGTTNRVFCNKIVKYISGISMEIYLAHMMCFRIVEKLGVVQWFGSGVFSYVFVTVIVLVLQMISIPIVQKLIELVLKNIQKKTKQII